MNTKSPQAVWLAEKSATVLRREIKWLKRHLALREAALAALAAKTAA